MPCDTARRKKLFEKLGRLKPDMVFLVFSTCCRSRDLLDRINHFEELTPHYLIAGHLDETERWGTIPAITGFLDVPLAYTMNSPGGIGLLKMADADILARNILKMEVADAGR
jgi:flagellar biosynthesis GTPase FlhF